MKTIARCACALTAALVLMCHLSAAAQYVPAGLQGTWKVKKHLTEKSRGCFDQSHTKALMGTKLSLNDHQLIWNGLRNSNPSPRIEEISPYAFQAKFGLMPQDLGLPNDKVSILEVNPSEGIPVNAVIALGPATILIDVCNTWLEAQHDGPFMDPGMPQ